MISLNFSDEEKKAILSVKNFIYLQEVLQVMADIKPVARFGYEGEPNQRELLVKVISDLGLELRFYKESRLDKADNIYYIGRSLDLIKEAHKAKTTDNFLEFGKLTGYPECCLKSLLSDFDNIRANKLPYSHKNALETHDYRVNNVYSPRFQYITDVPEERYYEYFKGFYEQMRYFYISHVPCSYTCKKSIELAKKVESILEKNFPSYNKSIKDHLQKGFIILDKLKFIVVAYDIEGGKIKYTIFLKSPLVKENALGRFKDKKYAEIKDGSSIKIYNKDKDAKEVKCKMILFR